MSCKLKSISVLFFILLLFAARTVCGQNSQKSIALKLYTNFYFDNTAEITETDIGYFSPALLINAPNGNFQEFELSRLRFNRTEEETIIHTDSIGNPIKISGSLTMDIYIGFRYEYNIRFFKSREEAKLRPSLGFSINPYYSNLSYKPMISLSYPSSRHVFGANLSLIPRIHYYFNDKWFLDLNIPVNLASFSWNINREENPTSAEQERTTSTIELSEFPGIFQIRIGIGFTL